MSVARSMIFAAPLSTVTHSTSASTSRPSASVLWTSIVLPLRAVSTSPSLYADGPVMFSTSPIRPITLTGSLSRAMACIAPSTVAAPDMSHFIVSIESVGLSDRPPESNVTPLPTNANSGSLRSAALITQNDHPRLASRPASDSQQRAAALLFQSGLVPNLGLQAVLLRHLFGLRGERSGVHVLRRLVHQPASEIDAFADDPAALDRRWIAAGPKQLVRRRPFFLGPIKVLPLPAGHCPGDRRLGDRR